MNDFPEITPVSISLSKAEAFEGMSGHERSTAIGHFDEQARRTALMHTVYHIDTRQAGCVETNPNTPDITFHDILDTSNGELANIHGSFGGFKELILPHSVKTSDNNHLPKLCLKVDSPTILLPSGEFKLVTNEQTVYVPVLSIAGIRKALIQNT